MRCRAREALAVLLSLFLFAVPVCSEEVLIHRRGSAAGKVALSFDDGPHAHYTEEILQILSRYNVRATFFVIGENARQNPAIVKKIAEAGHEIGNHTDSHAFLKNLSLPAMCKEVQAASDTLEEITGERPRLFRPPGGSYSDKKIKTLKEMGYVCVLWSKDTRDWSCPTVQSVVDSALCDLSGGDIILFHDFNGSRSPTPEALLRIIPAILEEGFEIVPVGELLGI